MDYGCGSFKRWAEQRRNDPRLESDSQVASAAQVHLSAAMTQRSDVCAGTPRRGRPANHFINPVADFMRYVEFTEHGEPSWVGDIIYGSIATAIGSASGKLRARVSDVRHAVSLPVISAEAVRGPYMSLRTAQGVAKAARHAAHGIHHFLLRRPELLSRANAHEGVWDCAA